MVVLPSTAAPDVTLKEAVAGDVVAGDEADAAVEPPAGPPAAVHDPDQLDEPIAYRKPYRYKPQGIGSDFVPK